MGNGKPEPNSSPCILPDVCPGSVVGLRICLVAGSWMEDHHVGC